MASRTPLKIDGTNVKEMSSTDYDNIVARTAYLYHTDPSVTLSVVGSSGSLDSMSDTRTQAGSATTHASSFRSSGDTPDVSTVTVTYDKITESTASLSAPADTNNIRFPVWNNELIYYPPKNVTTLDGFLIFFLRDRYAARPLQQFFIPLTALKPFHPIHLVNILVIIGFITRY